MKKKKILYGSAVTVLAIVIIAVLIFVILNQGHRVIKVASFSGVVTLQRDSENKDILENMNLKSMDVMTTGADGLIELLADEDKHIVAIENTCFAIESSGNEKGGALKVVLKYGTSLIEVENKLPEGSSFEVNTSNATLSIRGTIFEVTYIPETHTTILKVVEGIVQVDTNAETAMVNAGEMAVIRDDKIEISELVGGITTVPGIAEGGVSVAPDVATGPVQALPLSTSGNLIDFDDLPSLLKGDLNEYQLNYLLGVASRCEYNYEDDYLKDALYWMCCQTLSPSPYEPVEDLGNGELAYDVAELNKLFSFLTEDTISEENLNPGINRLEGERLICTSTSTSIRMSVTASTHSVYYEGDEIIVEYAFILHDDGKSVVENYIRRAHLVPDETGKYVLDYLE